MTGYKTILTLSGVLWVIGLGGCQRLTRPVEPTQTPEPTATPTATPSATPRPSNTPRPSPTETASPTPDPSANDLYGLTERYALQYGVDGNKLRAIAQCESGFNPQAVHLTYAGLYQFSPGAWSRYRTRMREDPNPELRYNSDAAIKTAAYVLSINESSIWPNCVR